MTAIVSGVLVLFSIFCFGFQGWLGIVFVSDVVLLSCSFAFVLIEFYWYVFPNQIAAEHAAGLNLLAVSLLILTFTLHSTFDNPYIIPISFFLSTRTMYKFLRLLESKERKDYDLISLILNCAILCVVLVFGVAESQLDEAYCILIQYLLLVAALVLSSVMLNSHAY